MARWDPDAGGRLQQAALELYLERGYSDVTVAEIAESVGLTKRTFFRYFADKREVLFAGAQEFQAGVLTAVSEAADDVAPIDVVVTALDGWC
jgi:AcrR family transcriptional regulator